MRIITLAAAAATLALLPSLAQQQPVSSTSTAGLVTKMNIADLKAVYDSAGVAYDVLKFDDGKEYLSALPGGYRMYAILSACPEPAKTVDCEALILESGAWDRDLTGDQLAAFNARPYLGKAFFNGGKPAISYTFILSPGVSPEYVRSSLRNFVELMKFFGGFEWLPSDQAVAAPTAAPGGTFAAPVLSAASKSVAPQSDTKPVNN